MFKFTWVSSTMKIKPTKICHHEWLPPTTVYLSWAFLGSLTQNSISPTAASHMSLKTWYPHTHSFFLNSAAIFPSIKLSRWQNFCVGQFSWVASSMKIYPHESLTHKKFCAYSTLYMHIHPLTLESSKCYSNIILILLDDQELNASSIKHTCQHVIVLW